ncbi:MAG: phage terminase large subunit [Leptospira sp.]|nr:phage terminase large subunit [Leptospira sp.]
MAITAVLPLELRVKIAREIKSREDDSEKQEILSFKEFIRKFIPHFKFYWHTEVIIQRLQDVADGKINRLMIFLPPRHSKSELVSRIFPAYIQYAYKNRHVGLCSYSADLATGFGWDARENYKRTGGRLLKEASKKWKAWHGGEMWSAGVGGPITGKGFHIGEIDDPIKNAQDAQSETIRTKHIQWYQSTFYSRAEPGEAIILCMTRWHEGDLAGWLLDQEKIGDEESERWHIIHYEAIKTSKAYKYPDSCTVEPDPRKTGDALCPERYPVSRLKRIEKRIGSYYWNALYQGWPTSFGGNIVRKEWIREYTHLPEGNRLYIQSWDLTFDDTVNSDYVVGTVWCKIGANKYLIDMYRKQADIIETMRAIRTFKSIYPETSAILIENAANGKATNKLLKNEIAGIILRDPAGSKPDRLRAAAPQFEAGNVFFPKNSAFVDLVVHELLGFPTAKHDDIVDTISMGLLYLENPDVFKPNFVYV